MRGCEEYVELANLLPDGLLTGGEKEALEKHLEHCRDCCLRVEAANAISSVFSDTALDPPDTLAPGIKYKLTLEPSDKKSWRRFMPGSLTVAAACIAFLIIFSQSRDAGSPVISSGSGEYDTTLDMYAEFEQANLVENVPSLIPSPEPSTAIAAPERSLDAVFGAVQEGDDSYRKENFTNDPKAVLPEDSGDLLNDKSSETLTGGSMPIPDGVSVMGITLMPGDIPEDLKKYDTIEDYNFIYILMSAEEYTAFTAEGVGVSPDIGVQIDPNAELGMVVFSK